MPSFRVNSEPKPGETTPMHVVTIDDAEPGLSWKLFDLSKSLALEVKHAGTGLQAFTSDARLLAVVTAKLLELGYTEEKPAPQVQA